MVHLEIGANNIHKKSKRLILPLKLQDIETQKVVYICETKRENYIGVHPKASHHIYGEVNMVANGLAHLHLVWEFFFFVYHKVMFDMHVWL